MNKTVNINLAGIFFHIDEDAYLKLQRYIEAIKRSFTDSQGRNEIIADIEARIAELFSERVQNEKQVVSIKEVEEVITIMGQPEDYMVDEEIFDDEPKQSYSRPKSSPHKRLYRDTESAYIGGVSSGLAHYFGIDALWIRLIWVALVFGAGTGILIYILLWILMPAAETTAEKLAMSGKPINITNIEEKVKEGFGNVKDSLDEVAEKVKNGDYNKVGDRVKDKSRSFFDALGNVIVFFFKIIAKFIGVIMIIVGASVIISLFVSLLSVGTSSLFDPWWMDYAHVGNSTDSPIWLAMLITFFAVGIPFFFVFLLGLKILVINLKPIGKIAGFTLLGLWLASIIALSIMAVDGITQHATDGSVIERTELPVKAGDTLRVKMQNNDFYAKRGSFRSNQFRIVHDENENKKIYSTDIRMVFRSTKDSIGSMTIDKNAEGSTYQRAKETAGKINYNYSISGNEITFDAYLLTDIENKFRDQEVIITVYLPEGSVLYANDNTDYFHRNWRYSNDLLKHGMEEHYLKVIEDDVICLDCPETSIEIKTKVNDTSLEIDDDGLEFKSENIEATIDSSGVNIQARDN